MKDRRIKYNLLFVPHLVDRVKLNYFRRKICKSVFSTQALQYPVHMSLISGGFFLKDYDEFEKELKSILSKTKPITLHSESSKSFVLPEKFWTGIHINRNDEITSLQGSLQCLRNKYADEKKELKTSQLHITFAFPAKVDELVPVNVPIKEFNLDRVTIVKKYPGEMNPYVIHKHLKLDI